jgi:hypothetical protein
VQRLPSGPAHRNRLLSRVALVSVALAIMVLLPARSVTRPQTASEPACPSGMYPVTIQVGNEPREPQSCTNGYRTLTPIAKGNKALHGTFLDALGARVAIAGKQIVVIRGERHLTLTVGQRHVLLNGKRILREARPELLAGYVALPLREVAETFGAMVAWSKANREVVVTPSVGPLPKPTPTRTPTPGPTPTRTVPPPSPTPTPPCECGKQSNNQPRYDVYEFFSGTADTVAATVQKAGGVAIGLSFLAGLLLFLRWLYEHVISDRIPWVTEQFGYLAYFSSVLAYVVDTSQGQEEELARERPSEDWFKEMKAFETELLYYRYLFRKRVLSGKVFGERIDSVRDRLLKVERTRLGLPDQDSSSKT